MGAISHRLQQLKSKLTPQQLAREAYKYFRDITPIRSGNARSNTTLRNDTIYADYPYAQRLDEGWSKQAPRGMTAPTEEYMRKYTKKQGK